jgi:hypothetical protein
MRLLRRAKISVNLEDVQNQTIILANRSTLLGFRMSIMITR